MSSHIQDSIDLHNSDDYSNVNNYIDNDVSSAPTEVGVDSHQKAHSFGVSEYCMKKEIIDDEFQQQPPVLPASDMPSCNATTNTIIFPTAEPPSSSSSSQPSEVDKRASNISIVHSDTIHQNNIKAAGSDFHLDGVVDEESGDRSIIKSPPTNDKQLMPLEPKRHCKLWFPHGVVWTLGIILLSIASLTLSINAMKSTNFALLRDPVPVNPDFLPLDSIGLVNVHLCSNSTTTTTTTTTVAAQQQVSSSSSSSLSNRDKSTTLCEESALTTNQNDDHFWMIARLAACLAAAFGFFLTVIISTTVCWDTINFKPIAVAYFLVYFSQSITFFFFASDLCRVHVCRFDRGAVYSVLATFFWMVLCLVCVRMDVAYHRKQRRRLTRSLGSKISTEESTSGHTISQDATSEDLST